MPSVHPSSVTILVVDDDRGILEFIETVLRAAGYNVLCAISGWNAIETYDAHGDSVHLLVTDVIMPDLTGPVIAERLRARQPGLQVLFISGCHDADLLQRFVTQKGFGLLPKPFTMEGLLRAVEGALKPSTFAA